MRGLRAGPCLRRIALGRDDAIDRSAYPFAVPAIASLRQITVRSRVLCFVGENGSGKSTMLEAIALASGFGHEGGTRNFRFSTQDRPAESPDAPVERLADALRLSWARRPRDGFFLRAESFYNVATHLDRMARDTTMGPSPLASYGGVSLHQHSHGESFFTLFLERFGGNGFYLLDEPEAALSAARQLALMLRMRDLLAGDEDTQFVIATHSPILLGFPEAQICSFDGGRMHEIAYRDTDAYILTRRFLDSPERMLRELFDDPAERA
jgi:predicted ATPase